MSPVSSYFPTPKGKIKKCKGKDTQKERKEIRHLRKKEDVKTWYTSMYLFNVSVLVKRCDVPGPHPRVREGGPISTWLTFNVIPGEGNDIPVFSSTNVSP